MGLTGFYNSPVSDEVGISIIKDAFNKGITFFDTSNVYGPHTNEILVGKVCFSFLYFHINASTFECLASIVTKGWMDGCSRH